jgi:hypothetical protein
MNLPICNSILAGLVFGALAAQPLADTSFRAIQTDYQQANLLLPEDVTHGALLEDALAHLRHYRDANHATDFLAGDYRPAENLLCVLPAACLRWDVARLRVLMDDNHLTPVEAAAVHLVTLAQNETSSDDYLRRILHLVTGHHMMLERALLRVGHVMGWGSDNHALKHLAPDGRLEDIPALAIYCVLRYPDDPQQAIKRAVYSPGQRIQTAGLVGAICGARCGTEIFPATARSIVQSYLPGNQP